MDKRIQDAAARLFGHIGKRKVLEDALIDALAASPLTAKEIAAAANISEQYLSDVKNRRRAVSDELARKLAGNVDL